MNMQAETEPEVRVSTLLGGIAQDARRLFVEQLALFQVEIKNDFHRTLQACIPLLAGMLIVTPAIVLMGVAAALALCALAPDLPLWTGFAIVGGSIGIAGMTLLSWGLTALHSVKLTPEKALEGLKENLQWKTKN
jgi:hypothetical protein